MRTRSSSLLSVLAALQRKAEREREVESITARVDREKTTFVRDRLPTATKADVVMLLERIESVVDVSFEGGSLVTEIRRIRREFELHQDLSDQIADREALKDQLEQLKYAELLASQSDVQSTG